MVALTRRAVLVALAAAPIVKHRKPRPVAYSDTYSNTY